MFLLLKFANVVLVFCNSFAGVATGTTCFEHTNILCFAEHFCIYLHLLKFLTSTTTQV